MASLKKRGKKYYAVVVWRVNGMRVCCDVHLQTKKEITTKTIARERLRKVENVEQDIRDGILVKAQFKSEFPWLNPEGTSQYESLRLMDVIPEYLKYRKNVVRKGSYERDYYSLKQLTRCLGGNQQLQQLNYKTIEGKFIPFYLKKGYGNNGINLSLRTLKIFFHYLLKEKLIAEKIEFKMLKKDDTPCYINRHEINTLHDVVDDKWQRWFYFYEMTGCRASDPFKGYLDGNVWKINQEETKTPHMHYYELTDELKYIWLEMQDFMHSYLERGKSKEYAVERCYSIVSTKMCRTIKQLRKDGKISVEKKLTPKSFRHTFGILLSKRTGSIHLAMERMNHGDLKTTQGYLDMPDYLCFQEFPELEKVVPKSTLQGESIPNSRNVPSPHTPGGAVC